MTASERFALDTNVLVYLFDDTEPDRQARARLVAERAVHGGRCVLSLQSVDRAYERNGLLS